MPGLHIILVIAVILLLLGIVEMFFHRRTICRIPIRIHVNGTRGKSSVKRSKDSASRHDQRS